MRLNWLLTSLVEAMQRRGVHVSVVSTISSNPPMVADELRRQADEFIDIVSISNRVGREQREGNGGGSDRQPRARMMDDDEL